MQKFGSVEAALAAYNAGPTRVAQWLTDRRYSSPPEFVESIPFSQTRHYVEVVLNGAVIYHDLYEASSPPNTFRRIPSPAARLRLAHARTRYRITHSGDNPVRVAR